MALRDLIRRRTVRVFQPQAPSPDTVRRLIETVRWTGSARNRQPWRFVAVYDAASRAALAGLGAYAGHVAAAPLVLVLLEPADRRLDTEFDLGRVAQSLTLAATDAGLGSCVVSLYPEENSRAAAALVGAGPEWSARHAIALGLPAEPPTGGRSAIPLGRHDVDELLRVI